MRYEKPCIVTLTLAELENTKVIATLQELEADGGGCQCQAQCQCQCQCQHQ